MTSAVKKAAGGSGSSDIMPVLFVGHGSPMNAIEETEFSMGWREMAKRLPRPEAILCISAHWETRGTFVTAMDKPRTIHDFGGFPRELFEVQYPAPGGPVLARKIKDLITTTEVGLDAEWGLDHGCWSVIKHMYPAANVPVIQMSLDHDRPPEYHYTLAHELSPLRTQGILIVGSGNVVHNLGMIDRHNEEGGFDWALEARDILKKLIEAHEHERLIDYRSLGRAVQLAVPTPEHYLPLLYILALEEEDDERISFFNDKMVLGSLSMLSLKIGRT
jgi:4,5-DOPA dioxygenase extradiol